METKHGHLKNKPQERSERQLRQLSNTKKCLIMPDAVNKAGVEASYMVSHRVAKAGKPHMIVEELILPAAYGHGLENVGGKRPNILFRECLHQTIQ